MTSAAKPVVGPLHSAEAQLCYEGVANIQRPNSNPQKTKKRLIATRA